MSELAFVQKFYGSLALMALAFWGLGQAALQALRAELRDDPWLRATLALALGLGLFIVGLQALAVAGQLSRSAVLLGLAPGWCLALWRLGRLWQDRRTRVPVAPQPWTPARRFFLWMVLCALLPTLVAPLRPPLQWDDLMYHLPHARQWAQSGSLTVNEWLRYPWFPYNYDLLFAAALLLKGDILAQLLHALAGWLTAALTYRAGLRLGGPAVAGLATTFWLTLGGMLYASAYIDLAVALWLTAAAVASGLWWQDRARPGWLIVGAFMLGLGAGSKYQALVYLPFFGALLLWRERRPAHWAAAGLAFLLPCAYWYVRNLLQTGDPFDPLGARLFGFHDWNEADMQAQFDDLRRVANWPPRLLWPALAALLLPRCWREPAWRGVLALSAYACITWLLSSHYDRYLLPAFALLALLSALVLVESAQALWRRLPAPLQAWQGRARLQLAVGLVLALALGAQGWRKSHEMAGLVAVTPAQREALLTRLLPNYALLQRLQQPPGRKIYQFLLENSIYYAPNPIWGDVFGPWRYHDFEFLPAPTLAQRLHAQGFDTLLVRRDVLRGLQARADFDRCFRPIDGSPEAQAFAIVTPPCREHPGP